MFTYRRQKASILVLKDPKFNKLWVSDPLFQNICMRQRIYNRRCTTTEDAQHLFLVRNFTQIIKWIRKKSSLGMYHEVCVFFVIYICFKTLKWKIWRYLTDFLMRLYYLNVWWMGIFYLCFSFRWNTKMIHHNILELLWVFNNVICKSQN